MRKVPVIAVVLALVLPGVAAARDHHHPPPSISIAEAHTAVGAYAAGQHGQVTNCWRLSRDRVACGVSIPCQMSAGPVSVSATATIDVFDLGSGPELKRVGDWSFTITE